MNPVLVRIFDVDFYLSTPVPNLDVTFSQFRGSATHQVPVIRIFGSTDIGKKICLHVHGIFPYFYIPYDGSEPANGLMYKIASNLDKAINVSLGQTSSNNQHIYKIILVSGIPFYGYHSKKHQFFKVYLYNPMLIKRVNNLLFNESILGKIYQPHETHLNFTLQFMIDYNLHGMSNIILSQVIFRHSDGVKEGFIEENLSKVSSCELEGDTLGEYILNRQEIESGNLAANPGIAALWEDEKQRRRNKNETSQLPHYLSLSKTDILPTESHELFKRALQERLAILSQDLDKNDFNLSVYPAECPGNKSLMDCSNVDYNSPLNTQSDLSYDSEFDQTFMNDTLNLTLDQDVLDLLDVLKDLEQNVDVEEDSILSQIPKNEPEDIEEDNDMSISIDGCDILNETFQFPQISEDSENVEDKNPEKCSDNKEKLPSIPQLDGNCSDFEVEDSLCTPLQKSSNNKMFAALEFEKLRSFSTVEENSGIILHTAESNISLNYLPDTSVQYNSTANKEIAESLENRQTFQLNNSIVYEVKILNEENPAECALEYCPQICHLHHEYQHVEQSVNMLLHHPKIIEARKINHNIIRSLIGKQHNYFTANSIGERVALKNLEMRKKNKLTSILEYPCELVVLCSRLHSLRIAEKKRDMPSLDIDSKIETCTIANIARWKMIRNFPVNNISSTKKKSVKKSIQRNRTSQGKGELYRNYHKRKLLVKKLCEKFKKCFDKLNEGAKPSFRVIPGCRPYTFQSMKIKKIMSIQTLGQSTHSVQLSSMVISNGIIPSNIETEQINKNGCDLNENVKLSIKEPVPILRKSERIKKNKEHLKNELQSVHSTINDVSNKNSSIKQNKVKKSSLKKSEEKIDEKNNEVNMLNSNQEDDINNNNISKNSTLQAPIKKSIEEIMRAQKENEAIFFQSVHSLMENCTISENKLLQSTSGNNKKDILFLDGAFDDSDEDEQKKRQNRNKKGKSAYSALPIVKTSGRTTPVARQNDSNKKTEAELIEKTEVRQNMKKIKKRLNFDSSYVIDNQNEQHHTEPPALDNNNDNLEENSRNIHADYNSIIQESAAFLVNAFVSHYQLSASEMYDLVNNYYPQPCCSKNSEPYIQNDEGSATNKGGSESELDDVWLSTPETDLEPQISPDIKASAEGSTATDDNIQSSGSTSDMFSNNRDKKKGTTKFSNDLINFIPIYGAPTKLDVMESLSEYGIPLIRPQEPFYSNVEDASKSLEIGHNLLKVKTLTTIDVPDFQSSFEGLEQFRQKYYPQILDQRNKQNPRYFYCAEGDCILRPSQKPPTKKEIENWLQQNSVPIKVVDETKTKKSKIYFASSQDIYSDNDMSMDLTLTLSPTTPKTERKTDTPESSFTSVPKETDLDREAFSPTSTKSEGGSPKGTRHSEDTPESNVDSDTSLKDESFDPDVTLTPRSSRSGAESPVLSRAKQRKKPSSMTLRKSALLSNSLDHSGVISGATLNNTYGFQCSVQNYQAARASVKYEYLTILSMELHVNTRGDFKPNPQYDSIQAIFYCISNDVEENTVKPRSCEGIFVVDSNPVGQTKSFSFLDGTGISCDIEYVENELKLFEKFTKFIIHWDPDILLGYEIQMLSWGYLIERCFHLGINIIPDISRVKDKHLKFNEKETGDLRISGRVVLDLWRLLRHEIALQSYTIQSTVYEILQRRIPSYTFKDLTSWWSHQSSLFRHRTVNYYMTCVRCQLKILEQLDFVGRTSELARLFGIQFYEVLSRGSQFRVESMMLRLAKPLNYVAVSPSVQQRAKMKAPEHIALVLEPESKLYTDPVIVLDFQSLYPSIIIAYNYCFSTCVGRVDSLGKNTPFEFGATNLRVSKDRIKYLFQRNLLNFSPCGVAFVNKSVRDGIMPRMLREILDTRLMVKKSMKENKDDAVLQKVLHSRQLGLKLIANVTYGYTAANFSGRMPSVELGDSIVSKARETLQRTISLVDNNKKWGVRVVYGDTDSLFVLCPGKSRTEAFAIGEEIVEAVGKENPDPVKLKLEKVYQPCILQTKKRYVGYMYESPEQKVPTYDAKGIETVRRDGCPAVSKMLEKTLRILFESKDVSKVKAYCVKQFNKIILGRISLKELTFAKEFRGLTGYRPGACVPSLELAKKWVAVDKRAEPRRGERVPYVIINGPPGLPLIRMVRSPHELLKDPALKPNALYYITRVIIPPLNRCFNLIGVDMQHWFLQMPRKHLQYLPTATSPTKKSTISQYFVSTLCAICGVQTQYGLCNDCQKKPQQTVTILNERARQWEASYNNCKLICSSCTQILEDTKCISLDCPVLYRLNQTNRDLQQADHIRHLLSQYFEIF
ncbi:DNA polymerase zeta catalytic subunit isoform X2 [Harmonia axyridis]|uniref:DNA polymerase zeta catalytic subunit isoform X2 n=1 Tax=Harmonia axyridis TaxID=115357 RepID=UPI001E275485|nr:DNA polymerase zeta catalytic subunit isoform X2 [Harmonia axyridis]